MKLPGGDRAIVDREKLVGHCLSVDHPRGKHKARMFARVLGFNAEYADELREALLEAAAGNDATVSHADRYGERYVIDFVVSGPRGTGTVRSTWILLRGDDRPRLTSCYVKQE